MDFLRWLSMRKNVARRTQRKEGELKILPHLCLRSTVHAWIVSVRPCRQFLKKMDIGFSFTVTTIVPFTYHVRYGDGEAVFNIENGVELRESQGLKLRELAKAERLAEDNKKLIIEKWHEHLG